MNEKTAGAAAPRLAGQGAIFLCALLWSTSGLFIKLVDWHPMVISGGRSILAAAVLIGLRFITEKPQKIKLDKDTFKNTLILAGFGAFYAATMILFVIANKLTTSANAILLQYTAPAWTALIGWFVLRERLRWEQWFTLGLVTAGMFLVFSNGLARGSMLGDIIALLSGIAFAANAVVLRLSKDGNPADILIFSHIICALFSLPFFFLYPPTMNTGNTLSILFMGLFQIGAASALFAYGIKRITAIQAMLIATIEPVLNPLWVFIVTGEKPALSAVAGGCIIVAAIIFSALMSASRFKSSAA
ncbi:MAG: DMT family transporter [Treponema sp.]|nr:DMT family transporter [Treponema sp.]